MAEAGIDFEEKLKMSPLADSELNWYEFRSGANILKINPDGEKVPEGELYDYVICPDVIEREEYPEDALARWLSFLKPEGTLIFSCDNRFGLKYFCGTPDKQTGIPFMGINGYFAGEHEGRSFSKQELITILERVGIRNYRFYYPVPDERFPQIIFTDDSENVTNTLERLIDYNYSDSEMLGLEHRIFKEVISDKALGFCSNSFFLEVTKKGKLSDIETAVVTTDRGKKYAMTTSLRKSGRVIKRPLSEEGVEHLKKLCDYTTELIKKGVPVVETHVKEDEYGAYIEMPYIDAEPLSLYLDKLVKNDREEFVRLFDLIYESIKNSYTEKTGRVFIDLAPCNCFYMEGESPLLFYDQEFVIEKSTPEFAMYRTIKYYFASSKAAREAWSMEELAGRYKISQEMIDTFEKQESEFINSVRNTDDLKWLYEAATPDYHRIYEKLLGLKKEKKAYKVGYVPGVFDLFHTGHLRLIERCKARCEYLIVGVLTDELVEYYKGKKPAISCKDRMEVIGGLAAVDKVIPVDFSNTDKLDAWEQLHYDCHFSGDDHVNHWNDIIEELRRRGSNMEFLPYTKGISTTQIKEQIEEQAEE